MKKSNDDVQMLELKVETVKNDFEKYLSSLGSERIIFSAPFGTGKTYFLNKFFDKNSKYEKIMLRPVNYSVATNSDVFELIKHDILFELLTKPQLNFDSLKLDFVLATKLYAERNFTEILKPFVFAIPEVGKSIESIATSFEKLFNKIKNYKREIEIDEKKEIINFLKGISDEKGNIYEANFISGIISQMIEQIKSSGKKTILLIDDLDRIDPAHLFRILNVFASHFDIDKNTNKFEFDHLIFVCDITNVQRIYESFYGKSVDFTGYINKFFSKEIYEFDNTSALLDSLDTWLSNIESSNMPRKIDLFQNHNIIWRKWLIFLLVRMIQSKRLSLRTIKNQVLRPYSYKPYRISIFEGQRNTTNQFSWFILFNFMQSLFGNNLESLSTAILNSNFNNSSSNDNSGLFPNDLSRFIGELLVITDWRNRGSSPGTHATKVDGIQVEYDLRIDNDYIYAEVRTPLNDDSRSLGKVNYDFLIKEAFKVYLELPKTKISN